MKHHSIRKHLYALFSMALLIVCVLSVASASTLKSSLYFTNMQYYSAKTTTFDVGYAVTLKGKATKNAGSLADKWYMKFDSQVSTRMPTDGVVRSWKISELSIVKHTYQAVNPTPDDGFLTGSILCYQH